jgi:hypothetical protein
VKDSKLWPWFSKYIRLRDSDSEGYCSCFTCGRVAFWKQMDCGHGLGRQHLAIKYNQKNNHAQCGKCNLDGGRQDIYKEKVNKLYGENTWATLEAMTRSRFKSSDFPIDQLASHFKSEVLKLLFEKGLKL